MMNPTTQPVVTAYDLENYEAFCTVMREALEEQLADMYNAARGFPPEKVSLAISETFDLERLLRGKRVRAKDLEPMLGEDDKKLFIALREYRTETAGEEDIPAYRVFTNQALLALTLRKPGSPADLMQVPGIGAKTRDRYGEEILEVIREHQCQACLEEENSGSCR